MRRGEAEKGREGGRESEREREREKDSGTINPLPYSSAHHYSHSSTTSPAYTSQTHHPGSHTGPLPLLLQHNRARREQFWLGPCVEERSAGYGSWMFSFLPLLYIGYGQRPRIIAHTRTTTIDTTATSPLLHRLTTLPRTHLEPTGAPVRLTAG